MPDPIYPVRLLSPTRRRIVTVSMGSLTSKQLRALGWTSYFGPATVEKDHDGKGAMQNLTPEHDPRNGFVIPGTDPNLEPADALIGSADSSPTLHL